jgi:hypothetical protein
MPIVRVIEKGALSPRRQFAVKTEHTLGLNLRQEGLGLESTAGIFRAIRVDAMENAMQDWRAEKAHRHHHHKRAEERVEGGKNLERVR